MLQTADRRLNWAAGKNERRPDVSGGRVDGRERKEKRRRVERDTGEAKWFKVGGHIPS
jgi:hypothetical protein